MNLPKNTLSLIATITGAFLLATGLSYAQFAYQNPSRNPPGGDAAPPLHVGSAEQFKTGYNNLNLSGGFTSTAGVVSTMTAGIWSYANSHESQVFCRDEGRNYRCCTTWNDCRGVRVD